jgi:hypothetical protein
MVSKILALILTLWVSFCANAWKLSKFDAGLVTTRLSKVTAAVCVGTGLFLAPTDAWADSEAVDNPALANIYRVLYSLDYVKKDIETSSGAAQIVSEVKTLLQVLFCDILLLIFSCNTAFIVSILLAHLPFS